jgi:hypothetical protein
MSFDERPQDGYPQYSATPGRPNPQQPGHPQQLGYHQQQYAGHPWHAGDPEAARYPLQPGYYPDQQPAYGIRRDNSDATLALVLGVVGLATGLLIASPFAWWKGNQALAQIDAAPGVYGNRGMAVGGQITGIIGTVLLGICVLALLAMVIFLIALSGS